MPNNMGYGYARASHQDNMDSLPAQIDRITEYYNRELKCHGVEWGDVIWDDKPVSASKIPFARRPAGKKLIAMLRPGDHIIFDKIDRIWRSIPDFVKLMEYFKTHKIVVHILNTRGCGTIAMNTPMGNFMLTLMVAIAQLESQITSDRIKETFAHKRQNYEWYYKTAPFGTQIIISADGKRRLVWNPEERAIMLRVVQLVDDKHVRYSALGAIVGPLRGKMRDRWYFEGMYRAEKLIRALGLVNPMDMPRGKTRADLERLTHDDRITQIVENVQNDVTLTAKGDIPGTIR